MVSPALRADGVDGSDFDYDTSSSFSVAGDESPSEEDVAPLKGRRGGSSDDEDGVTASSKSLRKYLC